MLRTRNLSSSWIKRTIRPLYGWTQATPKSVFLDPAFNRATGPKMWPGMGYTRTKGDLVAPISKTSDVPYGLGALYVGGDGIDEPLDAGVNAFAVWVLDPGAEFEILAPAFDETASWVDPGDGTELLIHVGTSGANQGKLVPAGTEGATTAPVARLLKVVSGTKIVVGGLR